jgi:hypothetical protein
VRSDTPDAPEPGPSTRGWERIPARNSAGRCHGELKCLLGGHLATVVGGGRERARLESQPRNLLEPLPDAFIADLWPVPCVLQESIDSSPESSGGPIVTSRGSYGCGEVERRRGPNGSLEPRDHVEGFAKERARAGEVAASQHHVAKTRRRVADEHGGAGASCDRARLTQGGLRPVVVFERPSAQPDVVEAGGNRAGKRITLPAEAEGLFVVLGSPAKVTPPIGDRPQGLGSGLGGARLAELVCCRERLLGQLRRLRFAPLFPP